MKLYHFSDKKIDDKIKVDKFASNSYSFKEKRVCGINRSFFYTSDNIPEYHLKSCKYKYIVEIDKNKIYNLKADKLDLKSKFTNITDLLQYIKNNYIGCIYNIGYNIVCLFYDIEFKKILKLA